MILVTSHVLTRARAVEGVKSGKTAMHTDGVGFDREHAKQRKHSALHRRSPRAHVYGTGIWRAKPKMQIHKRRDGELENVAQIQTSRRHKRFDSFWPQETVTRRNHAAHAKYVMS